MQYISEITKWNVFCLFRSLSFLLPHSEPPAPTLPVLYNCCLDTFHEHTHSEEITLATQ